MTIDGRQTMVDTKPPGRLNPNFVDPAEYPGFYEDREELNARAAWTSENDKYAAALWGKNLLDQKLLGGIRDISILFNPNSVDKHLNV